MFRGLHNISLDAKGRIKLPKRHSETILEVSSGEVVLSIHPEDSCLLLYTIPEWLQIEEKVNRLPSLNPYTKRIRRKLIGHATECRLDKASRVLIPTELRSLACLDKKIVLSGQGKSFEIWDESLWNSQLSELDNITLKTDIPEEVTQLTL